MIVNIVVKNHGARTDLQMIFFTNYIICYNLSNIYFYLVIWRSVRRTYVSFRLIEKNIRIIEYSIPRKMAQNIKHSKHSVKFESSYFYEMKFKPSES